MKFTTPLGSFTALAVLSGSTNIVSTTAQLVDDLQFDWNEVKLPFAVSDIMATYMQGDNGDDDGFIIITGGCDSPKGNERANFGDGDLFACFSTSNKTLMFDPFANDFKEMAVMPHARQRHAAAVAHGELYLLGGRDSDDALVTAIDVRCFGCGYTVHFFGESMFGFVMTISHHFLVASLSIFFPLLLFFIIGFQSQNQYLDDTWTTPRRCGHLGFDGVVLEQFHLCHGRIHQ